jgi:hypothetical protein
MTFSLLRLHTDPYRYIPAIPNYLDWAVPTCTLLFVESTPVIGSYSESSSLRSSSLKKVLGFTSHYSLGPQICYMGQGL